ncbi:hypothetical protein BDV3_003191 [Batrachochytrium dendrobatidis]|nr:hypothetical protein BDEG_28372 [Batrachochytrium dendrobatidis JEL423]
MDTDMLDTPASSTSSLVENLDSIETVHIASASHPTQDFLDMEVNGSTPGTESNKKKKTRVIVTSTSMDLESHIANYKSRTTRIDRLIFIADRCPVLQVDALQFAAKELLETVNVDKYLIVLGKLNDYLTSLQRLPMNVDEKWVEQTRLASRKKTDQLEYELRTYRANSIKESIRMGHSDFGDHFYALGDLQNALKSYTRTKDYCTTPKHILDMCLSVVKTCIAMGTFSHAQTYLIKAETIPDLPNKETLGSKLTSICGILSLETGAYYKAAKSFLSIPFDHVNELYETISPNDVAVYGGLIALATFERSELKKLVFENSSFKQFLELEPQIREMIYAFYSLNFRASLDILGKIKNDLLLDMYLHDHVEHIYQQIRKKALVQYFFPFVTVDMNKMASSFNCTVSDLEREVAVLIGDGHIQARIDSHNKILRAKQHNQRSQLYSRATEIATDFAFQSRATLLRAKLLEMDLVQPTRYR